MAPPGVDAARDESPANGEATGITVEQAAERLLEDERLRGDLTDEEYGPLLDWALAQLDRAAGSAGEADGAAVDRVEAALARVRAAVDAIGRAVEQRAELSAIELAARLEPLLQLEDRSAGGGAGGAAARVRLRAAIDQVARQKGSLDGPEMVARLIEALDEAFGRSGPDR